MANPCYQYIRFKDGALQEQTGVSASQGFP